MHNKDVFPFRIYPGIPTFYGILRNYWIVFYLKSFGFDDFFILLDM